MIRWTVQNWKQNQNRSRAGPLRVIGHSLELDLILS